MDHREIGVNYSCPFCESKNTIRKRKVSYTKDNFIKSNKITGNERFLCNDCGKNYSSIDKRFYSKFTVEFIRYLVRWEINKSLISDVFGINSRTIAKMLKDDYPTNGAKDLLQKHEYNNKVYLYTPELYKTEDTNTIGMEFLKYTITIRPR